VPRRATDSSSSSQPRDIRSLKGIIGRPKKPVTIDDMNKGIEKMGRMP
jgi:hypothetical protein